MIPPRDRRSPVAFAVSSRNALPRQAPAHA